MQVNGGGEDNEDAGDHDVGDEIETYRTTPPASRNKMPLEQHQEVCSRVFRGENNEA